MGTEAFLGNPLLGVLSNLPVFLGAIGLLLVNWGPAERLLQRWPVYSLTTAFLLTRFLFLYIVVFQLGHTSSDLTNYFLPQARAVLAGELPYRDFVSSYSPLFPYVLALGQVLFGGGVLAVFAVFISADLLSLVLVSMLAARVGQRPWLAAWYYICAPVLWYFLVRYAQDETLLALFLVLSVYLRHRGKEVLAAASFSAGFLCTKLTFGLFLIPLTLGGPRPLRFVVYSTLPVLVVLAAFALSGANPLQPLLYESGSFGDGPSIWRLPVVFTSLTLGGYATGVLVLSILGVWLLQWRRGISLHLGVVATGCAFLIFSPKALPMYIVPVWPLVALWLADSRRSALVYAATLLNILLCTWWYLDAGGTQGQFGPIIQALAIAWTALIPLTTAFLGLKALHD